MDWNAAIGKNREALKRILAALVAMAGLADGGAGTAAAPSSPRRAQAFAAGRSGDTAAGHRRAWFGGYLAAAALAQNRNERPLSCATASAPAS